LTRRPRYSGRNPRQFHEKYKELNPEKYPADIEKIIASGKTPAGSHRPILVEEVVEHLRPRPGDIVVDCTLGAGGHTRAMLERVLPGGRVIGLDVDPLELPRTEARLRDAGYGTDVFTAHHGNFAGLPKALAAHDLVAADVIVADLGVSSMQLDNPDRGFSYKTSGPLDLRMNPTRGQPASALLDRLNYDELVRILEDYADEPQAALVADVLKGEHVETMQVLRERLRTRLSSSSRSIGNEEIALTIRRTLQALRIAVNDELAALDMLLRVLPQCLNPGGRVAILTFHSGEDRRVKKAFQEGLRSGVYAAIADEVVRPTAEEIGANPRASSAKLRWAIRSAD
jgi:16S rRNA (cytosine1402-N4)-methyltransferase